MAPVAILWPDEKGEWERLVPRLRTLLPHFLVFGLYDRAARIGPSIWLRCVLAGKIAAAPTPPRQARQAQCPESLSQGWHFFPRREWAEVRGVKKGPSDIRYKGKLSTGESARFVFAKVKQDRKQKSKR